MKLSLLKQSPEKVLKLTMLQKLYLTASFAFLTAIAVYSYLTKIPFIVTVFYFVMSILTFTAYAFDKSAAKYGKQRIRERTLHLLALFCGWPGAAAAQQIFRHKTLKKQFRSVFLITAFINTAVLSFFTIPGLLEKTADFMEKYLKIFLNSI
jgi:uncharacterized membrane protein YsdA (DUF1294 family)